MVVAADWTFPTAIAVAIMGILSVRPEQDCINSDFDSSLVGSKGQTLSCAAGVCTSSFTISSTRWMKARHGIATGG
jgi:hypothetical protein